MPQRKTFLLVPPAGSRVRAVRVRLRWVVISLLVLAAGFYGYRIPVSSYSLEWIEYTRKKNLAEQNNQLAQQVLSLRKHMQELNMQMKELTGQRGSVEQLTLLSSDAGKAPSQKKAAASVMPLNDMYELVNGSLALFERFAKTGKNNVSMFDSIPVLLPVGGEAVVTAGFGPQRDPFDGSVKSHQGLDFAGVHGLAVLVTADGTVSRIEHDRKWGNRITVAHARGYTTVYAHVGTVKTVSGKRVKRGECIGAIGVSGVTTGPHLHYEIRKDSTPVNPEELFYPDLKHSISFAAVRPSAFRE